MKDRDIRMRETIEVKKVRVHNVIELDGQRLRCDQVRKAEGGRIKLTEIRDSRRRPVRCMVLNPRKHVELVRR